MATLNQIIVKSEINPTVYFAGPELSGKSEVANNLNPHQKTYTSSSSPPGTLYLAEDVTLTGSGASDHTIDLTSFTDCEGVTKDGTGKQVQELRVIPDSGNSADIVVGDGDSNAYQLFDGNDVPVPDGGFLHQRFNDGLADIASGAKNVKFSGTGGDSFTVEMVIG